MPNPVRKIESVNAKAETLLQEALAEGERISDRLEDLVRLIDALIPVIPAERRVAYLQLAERFRGIDKPTRSDPINDNIIEFVKARRGVTTTEVREALTAQGFAVDQKRVANSLDYLARRNRVQRIASGWYGDPEAEPMSVERLLTERYGPPTHRGYRSNDGPEPDCY